MGAVAPPVSLQRGVTHVLQRGFRLHRLHGQRFAATAFNPGFGRSRFAPIKDAAGASIPTLYAGSSYECAAFESIFHDVAHDAPTKTVPFSRIQTLQHSILEADKDLSLVQLFEPDLNAWDVTRSQLIDTLPSDYGTTARWAEKIHAAHVESDGLIWTSRRCDPHLAILLFGDRVSSVSLRQVSKTDIEQDDKELGELLAFGRRAGITLTL